MSGGHRLPLFQRILGPAFERLPKPIRSLHAGAGWTLAEGRCSVCRGPSPFARAAARLLSLPPQARDEEIQVVIRAEGDDEVWTRIIAGQRFASTLHSSGPGRITERLGLLDFDFEMVSRGSELSMTLQSVRVLGLAVPSLLRPRIEARESVADGLFRFDIVASVPGVGQIVAYGGTLAVVEELSHR